MNTTDVSPFPMVVGEVEKNGKETIVIAVNEYKGKLYIDVRNHIKIKEDFLPTKKGITLNKRTFEPVVKAMIDAFKALEELSEKKNLIGSEEDVPEP